MLIAGKKYALTEEGYLSKIDRWSEDFAKGYADILGITLTEDHWKTLKIARNYYEKYRICPLVARVCKESGIAMDDMVALWGPKPMQKVCKVAGLEKPSGCV